MTTGDSGHAGLLPSDIHPAPIAGLSRPAAPQTLLGQPGRLIAVGRQK